MWINTYQGVIFLNQKRILNIKGAVLDKYQLEHYLEKIASDHILKNRADKRIFGWFIRAGIIFCANFYNYISF